MPTYVNLEATFPDALSPFKVNACVLTHNQMPSTLSNSSAWPIGVSMCCFFGLLILLELIVVHIILNTQQVHIKSHRLGTRKLAPPGRAK